MPDAITAHGDHLSRPGDSTRVNPAPPKNRGSKRPADCEGVSGSGLRERFRTFLPVEVTLRVDCSKKRRAGEKRHYFSWEELPGTDETQPATTANPVRIAREWKRAMEERGESRADLARRLGVSRARVSQVLGILDLSPDVLELLEQQPGPGVVSERALRELRGLDHRRRR